jgi:hypothetical protein
MVQAPATAPFQQSLSRADCGWRFARLLHPNGTRIKIQVSLTPAEFLHPKEGYYLPNSTWHDRLIADTKDILERRYQGRSDVGVFSDLIIVWDLELGNHSRTSAS